MGGGTRGLQRGRAGIVRRATLGLAAITALAAIFPSVGIAASTPVPAFHHPGHPALAIVLATGELQAGDHAKVVALASHRSRCALTLVGPGSSRVGPFGRRLRMPYATWAWRVPRHVRGGVWRAELNCRQGRHRHHADAVIHVAVSHGNRQPLVAHDSMHVIIGRRPPGLSGHRSGRKGGGGYPDDGARCKWTGRRGGSCYDYDWGYLHGGSWQLISPRGFAYRNCTDFAAWYMGLSWSSFHFPAGKGNAADWKAYAGNAGLQVTSHPSVGDIAWWGSEKASGYGHVAIVTAVQAGDEVTVAQYNGLGRGDYSLRPNVRADAYLHKPAPPPHHPTPTPEPESPPHQPETPSSPPESAPTQPEAAPTQPESAPTQPETIPTQPETPPAPKTWAETAGGVVHTWTNYTNAGGTQGPSISSGQTVQIACRLQGFKVADGNTWWYRIDSSPWSNHYYASADAFYNDGQTSGSLHGTPFVDPGVGLC